ncbi:MAG: SpoIIE family protein phosphatase [Thermoflexales bacterium]|nr:SpoIIE family protein phosphatase [Thermoflexales bacterium]
MQAQLEERLKQQEQEIARRTQTEETLLQRLQELTRLDSIIATLTSTLELGQVLQAIVDSTSSLCPQVQDATIQLLDETSGRLITWAAAKGLYTKRRRIAFSPGEGIAGLVITERRLVNVSDVTTHPQFAPAPTAPAYRSLLVAPLLLGERVLGTLSIESSQVGAFGDEEQYMVQLLASYAARTIENARLYTLAQQEITERRRAEAKQARLQEELRHINEQLEHQVKERTQQLLQTQAELAEQRRLQEEIELAAQVRASLMPQRVPLLDGFELVAMATPTRHVSGNLHDFNSPDPETCYIVLANMSGQGIGAAMLASTARALLHARVARQDSPAAILSHINNSLYDKLSQAGLVTIFFIARLNAHLGTLSYANAGHDRVMWWQHARQVCHPLTITSLALGSSATLPIAEERLGLRPGDALVLYSDGVATTASPGEEGLGIHRLSAIMQTNAHLSAPALAQAIMDEAGVSRTNAYADDPTLIVLKALPRTLTFKYPASLGHLTHIVTFVQQASLAYGRDFAYQLELASSEIVTAIIKRAHRAPAAQIHGEICLLTDRVQLNLYDNGTPVRPDAGLQPSWEPGTPLTSRLVDEFTYTPGTPKGNHWQVVKHSR